MVRVSVIALALLCCTCKRTGTDARPAPHALDGVLDGLSSRDAQAHKQSAAGLAKLLNEGALTPTVVEPRTGRVTTILHDALERVLPLQHNDVTTCGSWITEEAYDTVRFPTELLLDLGGMARAPEVAPELEKGLKLADPQLRWFAVRSLLRLGRPVDAQMIARLAEEDTVRGRVFETLSERGMVGLIPESQRTQEALARAELVEWLLYPTELGCEPNEIELIKVVPVGAEDHYVFRFRTNEAKFSQPPNTWVLGAAGPYPHGRVTSHGTATFSTFARADEKTAEQYVADLRSLIDHANKNIDPKTKTAPMPKSK